MDITYRGLMTALHGMFFGAFFLLALYGLALELTRSLLAQSPQPAPPRSQKELRWTNFYVIATAVMGWAAVFSGTYIIYPWYRAAAPAGDTNLHLHPKLLLLSQPATAGLHTLGMEWKEHVSFLAPIAATMIAYVWCRYRPDTTHYPQIRKALLAFALVALFATGVAGAFGAFLNKYAPVEGGQTMHVGTR